ncbi:hypothetical protein MACH09_40250 [Vibrio sp. MACH09]|nr:hypothetical protein MACH09_40250 [Vibrio sp. MACH09]
MISEKWYELYQYINDHIDDLPCESEITEKFNERLMFISRQFSQPGPSAYKQRDWLEHEAFTQVLGRVLQQVKLTKLQFYFLFDTLMAAELSQTAMVVTNTHESLLSPQELKCCSGRVHEQLGDHMTGRQMFEEAIAIDPANPTLYQYLGFNYLYSGEAEMATECFLESIEVAPEFIAGYQNLAGLAYQESDFEKALKYAELVFERDTSLPSTYITAISSCLALGLNGQADKWVALAFDHNVAAIELVRLAGITAHQNGRLEEALEALDHYLSVKENNFDAFYIRARVKAELDLYESLETDIKQLLVFEPHDEWCLEQLFLCYFQREQWLDAQQIMLELKKLSPQYQIIHKEKFNTINKRTSLNVVEIS